MCTVLTWYRICSYVLWHQHILDLYLITPTPSSSGKMKVKRESLLNMSYHPGGDWNPGWWAASQSISRIEFDDHSDSHLIIQLAQLKWNKTENRSIWRAYLSNGFKPSTRLLYINFSMTCSLKVQSWTMEVWRSLSPKVLVVSPWTLVKPKVESWVNKDSAPLIYTNKKNLNQPVQLLSFR